MQQIVSGVEKRAFDGKDRLWAPFRIQEGQSPGALPASYADLSLATRAIPSWSPLSGEPITMGTGSIAFGGTYVFGFGILAAPSVAIGESDTGFYSPAAGSLAAVLDGVEAWRISADGFTVNGRLFLRTLSPAQITADQNDYNPDSSGQSSIWRLTSDAARTITGIAGGSSGRMLTIKNVGAFSILIADQNASSVAANRIITALGATLYIEAGKSLTFFYDADTERWRVIDNFWLTTKGDALEHDGTKLVRVAVGSNGKVKTADSTQSNGTAWAYASSFLGDSTFGKGVDGSLTLVADTAVADFTSSICAMYYSDLTLSTWTLNTNSTDMVVWIHVSGVLDSNGGAIRIDGNEAAPAGGAASGGGGAGGTNGRLPLWSRLAAREITGTGSWSHNGGDGGAGGNATVATTVGNGALGGTGTNSASFQGVVIVQSGGATQGGGGVSTGAGGAAGVGNGDAGDANRAIIRKSENLFLHTGFSNTTTSGVFRMCGSEGDGSGAGGRNTGAQGAGGGGSGGGSFTFFANGVAGSAGGAGGAGAAGAGGGAGGYGGAGASTAIISRYCASTWTFNAKGGKGGDGGNGFGNGGGGGGGPGGAGGWVRVWLGQGSPVPTVSAAGGIGGTKGGPGAGGGNAGTDGNTGNPGLTEIYA